MTKIFNISLQRTGTQSLHDMLCRAGIKSIHWVGKHKINQYQLIQDKNDLIEKISILDNKFEAFNDMPYNILYDHYSKKYKDAKFIFVTRDFDSWWNSIQNFYEHEKMEKQRNNFKGLTDLQKICYLEYLNIDLGGKDFLSKEEYYEYYTKHYNSVYKYFEGSENFLSVSLFDKNLSKQVFNFLNIESSVEFIKKDFLRNKKVQ